MNPALAGRAVRAFLRSIVTGDESDVDARVGEALVGEYLVNSRLLAYGLNRKR